MSNKATTKHLIKEQIRLMELHGTRSEEVRQHILTNRKVGDYEDTALVLILLWEGQLGLRLKDEKNIQQPESESKKERLA